MDGILIGLGLVDLKGIGSLVEVGTLLSSIFFSTELLNDNYVHPYCQVQFFKLAWSIGIYLCCSQIPG